MTDARGETSVRRSRLAADRRRETAAAGDAEFGASRARYDHASRASCGPTWRAPTTPRRTLEDQERILPDAGRGRPAGDGRALEARGPRDPAPGPLHRGLAGAPLEELGVGRPSTYASIISTIQDRGYVWKKGSALVPSFTAFAVVTLLEEHFPDLVDYAFTARMEDDLDEIAERRRGDGPLAAAASTSASTTGQPGLGLKAHGVGPPRRHRRPRGQLHPARRRRRRRRPIVARVGRYGPYLQRGEDTASIPEDLPPDELTVERALELLEAPSGDRVLGHRPRDRARGARQAGPLRALRAARASSTEDGDAKPKTGVAVPDMELDTVTLDDALQLLSLPAGRRRRPGRRRGDHRAERPLRAVPQEGHGQPQPRVRGPAVHRHARGGLALLAQPKRGGARRPSRPLRELGDDPVTGKPMVLKDGRFGPYVTDGETNASLRKGDTVESLTIERALGAAGRAARQAGAARPRRRRPAEEGGRRRRRRPRRRRPRRRRPRAAAKKAAAEGAAAEAAAVRRRPGRPPASLTVGPRAVHRPGGRRRLGKSTQAAAWPSASAPS